MRGWLSLSSLAADTMLFTVWQNHPFIRGGSSCAVVQRERHAALSSVSLQLMNTTRRWHLFPNLNVFLIDLLIGWSRRMPVIHICVFAKKGPSVLTFPLWDQSGGSSWPWGSRPFSRQERNWSKWPPLGKRSGGLCIPSWLTSTTVPPLSTEGRWFLSLITGGDVLLTAAFNRRRWS